MKIHDELLEELMKEAQLEEIKHIPFKKALVDENGVLIAYLQDNAVSSEDFNVVDIDEVTDETELLLTADVEYAELPYKKINGKKVETDSVKKKDYDTLQELKKNPIKNRNEIEAIKEKNKPKKKLKKKRSDK